MRSMHMPCINIDGRVVTYIVDNCGCHICNSHGTAGTGYPRINIGGRPMRLSRVVYQSEVGKLTDGQVIRHTCDNPLCINPAHLIPGTHADNVLDRVARNRSAKGERNGRAKLTEKQVRDILASTNATESLARQYNVSPKLIYLIRRRKCWASLDA